MTARDDSDDFLRELLALDASGRELVQIVEALPEVSPSTALRGAILARATTEGRFARFAQATAELLDLDLERARALLDLAGDAKRYTQPDPTTPISFFWVDGGPRVANAFRGFMRVQAGTVVSEHTHVGDERVLVMQGAYEDLVTGQVVRAGEVVHNGPGTTHAIRALPDRPDLLKLVVVTEGLVVGGNTLRPS